MKKAFTKQNRRLQFENLESRAMLTGTVSTTFDNTAGGPLVLSGDNKANYVVIHQLGANRFQVQGIGTKINVNGTNFNSFTFQDVSDLEVDLQGGNDSLTIYNTTINGTLSIDMGDGNDVLSMTNVHEITGGEVTEGLSRASVVAPKVAAGLDASITLGLGNDVAAIYNLTSDTDIFIDAGDGRDAVALSRVAAGTVGSGNTLSVEMGPGNYDALAIALCSADIGSFSDTGGTNGIITGAGNHFGNAGSTVTPGDFRWQIGIS